MGEICGFEDKVDFVKVLQDKSGPEGYTGGTFFLNKVDSSEVISKVYYYYTREKYSNIIE